jgi:hypothetical protein
LRIHKRMKDRHGEHIFCELPDGTICSLPSWMFRPESMHFPLGSPLISVEALAALHDLIGALRTPASCDMASLSQPPKEEMKRPAMPTNIQFNLPLLDVPAAALPANKQRELDLALVELLLNAARKSAGLPAQGDGNESEADE